jgi:tetratricopeptide (TPR) repeat protein
MHHKNFILLISLLLSFLFIFSCSQTAAYYEKRGDENSSNELYSEAIKDYDKAILLTPSGTMLYLKRGDAKKRHGHPYDAIADYSKAIEIDKNFALAYLERGILRKKLGDSYQAITDFEKGIEIAKDYSSLYEYLGYTQYELGWHDQALANFNKVIELEPNAPRIAYIYYMRGKCYYFLKRYSNACKDINQSAQLGYNDAEEWLTLNCN